MLHLEITRKRISYNYCILLRSVIKKSPQHMCKFDAILLIAVFRA